jgi:DNA transformation protein
MVNDSFKDYILDQLADLGGIECKRLFSGFGLYYQGRFFGIINNGSLFFKTSDKTKQPFLAYGARPFAPSAGQVLKNYLEVPAEIVENKDELAKWAKTAAGWLS